VSGKLRAVLFDMDGLLVDSEPLWFEAERSVMARMGGPWTEADQQQLMGGTLAHSVGYMRARALRPAEPAQIGAWLLDTMAALVAERGVPLMASTGLAFGVTVCAEDVRRSKPDPEPYLRAAALLGEAPGECVVLEDSPRGIASAQAAGCPVIAVPSMPLPAGMGRPDRPTAGSLLEVNLARLREAAAGQLADS
jgi:HAD superfamily hydrolase (TIGR01509 family)